jgi:hypothetical protein
MSGGSGENDGAGAVGWPESRLAAERGSAFAVARTGIRSPQASLAAREGSALPCVAGGSA